MPSGGAFVDSTVRAPIAAQQIKSAMYCGVIGSRNSVAVGTPSSRMSTKKFSSDDETGRKIRRAIEIRIHDQSLPTYRRARFLKVDTHHDLELFPSPRHLISQVRSAYSIPWAGIVNGTWSNDDEKAIRAPLQDVLDTLTWTRLPYWLDSPCAGVRAP